MTIESATYLCSVIEILPQCNLRGYRQLEVTYGRGDAAVSSAKIGVKEVRRGAKPSNKTKLHRLTH